jgi:hypothetical protein
MMIPIYSPEEAEAACDAAYDQGYEDAMRGYLPCVDCGDLEFFYRAGYDDGLTERDL